LNASILEKYNYDLNSIITSSHPSPISCSSEFKPSSDLQEILQHHPNWPHLEIILDKGATFPLRPISQQDRITDLNFHLERGNHKSTLKFKKMLDPIISEDVNRGFSLPFPLDVLFKILNASLAPLGCHKQDTINKIGVKIPKFRMTHDQSFPGPSGLSVNLRVIKESLPPIMYSFVLPRVIHYICNIRLRHPSTKIFICKVDLDSAYCRCHLSSSTAQESITI
jgi:hypothetical protein